MRRYIEHRAVLGSTAQSLWSINKREYKAATLDEAGELLSEFPVIYEQRYREATDSK